MNLGKWMSGAAALVLALSLGGAASAAEARMDRGLNANPSTDCDRACLIGIMDTYMKAFVAKDWRRLPLASQVKFTENNVVMKLGDGSWAVITGKGTAAQDLSIADPVTGQAAYMGVIEINGVPCWYTVRIKVENRKITEIEQIWRPRPAVLNPATPGGNSPAELKHFPEMYQSLAPAERTPRARMRDIADGYFSTLQLNDGRIFSQFAPDSQRNDNGTITCGVPDSPYPNYRQGCEEQFKLGRYLFDNALRERDYPLIDEEKGIVFARAFLDHDSRIINYKLTDGTPATTSFKTPHTFHVIEFFKIKNGALYRMHVTHIDTPYRDTSPWTPPNKKD
jgi:hypothetical protein